ncbi:UPF0283 membrane protein [Marinobacterium zhoushanense]|uniref:UPF0283 membrane protein n=1 Tax=Marinobacterium zhoushanense TaxID=1679163 RepID=A0ABQ1K0Q4_9GAMM|nr:TIGR01620 family protein [Marinobacterium zhoushanense]GGB80114.1 UPF0283 membrane protein [Marinobacterium zhoushanense]
MSEADGYRKPILLDPKQLDAAAPTRSPELPAREFPLQQVSDVGADDETADAGRGPSRKGRGGWRRLFGISVGAVLVSGVSIELYRLLDWSFTTHPALGAVVSSLLLLLTISGSVQLWRSFRGLRQLSQIERIQTDARALLQHKGQGGASALLRELQRHYRNTPEEQRLNETIRLLDSAYSDSEIVRYLSHHALSEQDERARRCVQRYAVESGVLVALSPWASFDMLLVGWRNLRMLREVAGIYGVAPGASTQWILLKRVLHNLAFAGLSEMAIDAGSAALGSSLTATLSARAGQGLGAGLFTARTGLQAQRLCRPLPLDQVDQSLIKSVAKGIVERLGQSKPAE